MSRLSGQHKARLIEYFCLGVPAYRLRFLMSVSQKTVQRFYKLLRICLYQNSLQRFSIAPIPPPSEGVAVFRDHPDKAGIIIESPTTNLSFSSNMDGIVDQRSEPGRGRYVLIIEPFTQIIVVDAPGYIQGRFRVGNPGVRDVLYYEIEPEERTPDLISVIFNVEPDDARLFVDNQQTETNRTVQLSPGSAEVRLERESYRTILDAITINPDNIQFNYVFNEVDIVPVRFSANTPGARVLIDGVEQVIIDDSGISAFFCIRVNTH